MSLAKNPSTALSHDAEVGVKWNVQRGCRVSHLRTCGCLWVEDNGMRGRIDVEANDVLELLGKLRVLRELETTNSVQRELVGLKDASHRPQADPRRPSQHPARPAGCFSRRRRKRQIDNSLHGAGWQRLFARLARLVADKPLQPSAMKRACQSGGRGGLGSVTNLGVRPERDRCVWY